MSVRNIMQILFPREKAHLRDQTILLAFLQQAVQKGYLIVPANEGYKLIRQMYVNHTEKPCVVSEVLDQLESFSQGKSESFDCMLQHVAQSSDDYNVLLDISFYSNGLILMDVEDNNFKYNLLGLRNYEQFIQFIAQIYQTWPLFYGYYSDDYDMPQEEAVWNFQANHLYELTVFGPEYVNHIGSEKFEAIRPWKKLPMPDGGYILVLGTYATYTQPDLRINAQGIAETLGLTAPGFFPDR